MTAYSFGNRWVGVVALGTPPPPEPLHKMAVRLRRKAIETTVRIDGQTLLSLDTLLSALAAVRIRMAFAGLSLRVDECVRVDRAFRAGKSAELRPWLVKELVSLTGSKVPNRSVGKKAARLDATSASPNAGAALGEKVTRTGWVSSLPAAPESAWLPPMAPSLAAEVARLQLPVQCAQGDHEEMRWVRWASLHSSYVYESIPGAAIQKESLGLLAAVGKAWMRAALLERYRNECGELSSRAEVSALLSTDKSMRIAVGQWAKELAFGRYSKGESRLLASGRASSAEESVGLQVVGALCLITASQAPADSILAASNFKVATPEPDWLRLVEAETGGRAEMLRSEAGSDHDKTFRIEVRVGSRSVSATAKSIRQARKEACRRFIEQYHPRSDGRTSAVAREYARPLLYAGEARAHSLARTWVAATFEVADAALVSQALTHSSWVNQNQAVVSRARQRDHGVLSTEGSAELGALVLHRYAMHALDAGVGSTDAVVRASTPSREQVAELFNRMPKSVADGTLTAPGSPMSPSMKEDFMQAIVGASWRANGDLLADRMPAFLSSWIDEFAPKSDAVTQWQEYCSAVRIQCVFIFTERGPGHASEFCAEIQIEGEHSLSWRGGWSGSKTGAKQLVAQDLLSVLFGQLKNSIFENSEANHRTAIRMSLLAELRSIDIGSAAARRGMAEGRLGVDRLAAGDFNTFVSWASVRSELLQKGDSAVVSRLAEYYEATLVYTRRESIRRAAGEMLRIRAIASKSIRVSDDSTSVLKELSSLALLERLIRAVSFTQFPSSILDFIHDGAEAIARAAGLELESERTNEHAGSSLTMRIRGAGLADAIDPIARVVNEVAGGVRWVRESQSVIATIPSSPASSDVVSLAGLRSLELSRRDPWLDTASSAVTSFLDHAENIIGAKDSMSTDDLAELAGLEERLLHQLDSHPDVAIGAAAASR